MTNQRLRCRGWHGNGCPHRNYASRPSGHCGLCDPAARIEREQRRATDRAHVLNVLAFVRNAALESADHSEADLAALDKAIDIVNRRL